MVNQGSTFQRKVIQQPSFEKLKFIYAKEANEEANEDYDYDHWEDIHYNIRSAHSRNRIPLKLVSHKVFFLISLPSSSPPLYPITISYIKTPPIN